MLRCNASGHSKTLVHASPVQHRVLPAQSNPSTYVLCRQTATRTVRGDRCSPRRRRQTLTLTKHRLCAARDCCSGADAEKCNVAGRLGAHWHCLVRSQDSLATLSCYPDGLAHIVLITLITPIKARVSVLNDLLHAHAYA